MSRSLPADRFVGLDVARCLALLGMVATHVLATRTTDGQLSLAHAVAGGRAAALFAVLAGVTLALMTGRREPVRGRERAARSAGIAVRAVLITAIGLFVGGLGSGLAIILAYYGVLFLLALPFLGLRPPALFALAAAWLVVTPVLSQVVRPDLPNRGFDSPQFTDLAHPWQLLTELLVAGYYPAIPWLAYLLVGLAVGRLDLAQRAVQLRLLLVGAGLAGAAYASSRLLTARADVMDALLSEPRLATSGPELMDVISEGMYGGTPTGGPWQWLLVVAPHSTTPFDLAHTIGTSLLVIAACLLLVGGLAEAGRRGVAIVFGAGTMTLSLYTLHAVMRTEFVLPEENPDSFPFHVVALMGVGALYVYGRRRGPLEWVVGDASRWVAARVRRRTTAHPVA